MYSIWSSISAGRRNGICVRWYSYLASNSQRPDRRRPCSEDEGVTQRTETWPACEEYCPVKSVKEMQKILRGTVDRGFDAENKRVVRWNGNIFNFVSNVYSVEPVQSATRWSWADRSRSQIRQNRQPFVKRHYNLANGGVDHVDQNIAKYISIRSKRWWWPVFMYCVDMAVQQIWHLYRAIAASRQSPLGHTKSIGYSISCPKADVRSI